MRVKTGIPEEEVLAEFDLAFHSNSVHITVHARGGSASSGAQTNPGYEVLIQTLLERLKQADCVLQDVLLASKTVASLARSQRRILLQGFGFPIPLSAVADIKDLRLAIRRAVMTFHVLVRRKM